MWDVSRYSVISVFVGLKFGPSPHLNFLEIFPNLSEEFPYPNFFKNVIYLNIFIYMIYLYNDIV